MRKHILYMMVGLCLALSVQAAEHDVTVAAKGGVVMLPKGTLQVGALAGLDVRYNCLFAVTKDVKLGLNTGIDAAYAMPSYQTSLEQSWTRTDQYGLQIDYTMDGVYKESLQQLQMTIPVQLALHTHGFSMGLGVGAQMMYNLQHKEETSDLSTAAYYPAFDVTIPNNDPAGLLTPADYSRTLGMKTMEWNVLLMAEVGYEWSMRKRDALGVQLFGSYAVWSTAKMPQTSQLIPMLEAGLKVYYRFFVGLGKDREHFNRYYEN